MADGGAQLSRRLQSDRMPIKAIVRLPERVCTRNSATLRGLRVFVEEAAKPVVPGTQCGRSRNFRDLRSGYSAGGGFW
jgi:hypothetical protein